MKLQVIEELLVSRFLGTIPVPTAVVLPNGKQLGDHDPILTLHARTFSALQHLITGNVGKIGSDYVEGELDIQGTPYEITVATTALMKPHSSNALYRLAGYLRSVAQHTLKADSRQIQFHYDVSDEFYALWLDPRRIYSCAYFSDPGMTLEQAQEAKLDLICRKLMLKPGDRFLDIGAGWGGLLLHAAERYGVDATGITLSKNQYQYVKKLIEKRGLKGQVRMKLLDYRDLDTDPGPRGIDADVQFDKIASVGMIEHVGRVNLPVYFRKIHTLLKPGGLLLNHGITSGGTQSTQLGSGVGRFIEKYIFPGGELQHVSCVMEQLAEAGLEALDVENLRPHYARTLWAWSDNLEAHLEEAKEIVGEKVVRAYRLYLAGCAANFEQGWLSLHQVLASRPDHEDRDGRMLGARSVYPFNRGYMYL